mmetsp:Transcript_19205/g.13893  ORF Transcript_19205/g.13893 Transcript_19205/m.13893 type:complete len:201 (-) Transcript_19205:495-1097(-)
MIDQSQVGRSVIEPFCAAKITCHNVGVRLVSVQVLGFIQGGNQQAENGYLARNVSSRNFWAFNRVQVSTGDVQASGRNDRRLKTQQNFRKHIRGSNCNPRHRSSTSTNIRFDFHHSSIGIADLIKHFFLNQNTASTGLIDIVRSHSAQKVSDGCIRERVRVGRKPRLVCVLAFFDFLDQVENLLRGFSVRVSMHNLRGLK